jgi:glycosyltransferase involved in cell wall biosynthesis
MRINVVLNSLPILSETFLISWIEQLVLRGYKVKVIIIGNQSSKNPEIKNRFPEIEFISFWNIKIIYIGILKAIKFKNIRHGFKYALISYGKPNLIHFSYTSIGIQYLPEIKLLQLKGVKCVVSCRGTSDNIKPYILKGRADLIRQLFLYIDAVHCVSQEMLNRMVRDFGLIEGKGFVNRPAINLNSFNFEQCNVNRSKRICIISTGRLEYVKGYIFGLMAIKALIEEDFNLVYKIVGFGKEKENMLFYINRLGLDKHVKLLGGMTPNEVIREVKEADVYLSCSLSEGISNAVLEAMALGVPVISTNVGGMNEVVIDKITGLLINPYSSLEISDSIKFYAENTDLKDEIIFNALELVKSDFNINRLGREFDLEYRRLLK